MGPGFTLRALVIGPRSLPLLEPDVIAKQPLFGMLATLANLDDPRCAEHALQTVIALGDSPLDADGRLADILFAAPPAPILQRLDELMRISDNPYQSDLALKSFTLGCEQGRTAGEAQALLVVLRSRGITVPADTVAKIEGEHDPARLERWLGRAATATVLEAVFAGD